ncbi:hypothetical protein DFJ73DRAFT_923903 [Zopfochytrium polystomum]|nr:hypothetical protein DFJ73DRAFT_923903 [Zopfochytrium polystomum]
MFAALGFGGQTATTTSADGGTASSSLYSMLSPTSPSAQGPSGGSSAIQELRKKQIATLLAPTPTLPPVRELERDALFELDLPIPPSAAAAASSPLPRLALQIRLGASFPELAPVVSIVPARAVTHPWIGASGLITGHERLTATGWSPQTSLARVVAEVVRELVERNPVRAARGPVQPSFSSQNAAPPPQQSGYSSDPYGLDKLSLEELEEIMNDERAFEQLLLSQPHVQEPRRRRQELISSNEQIARQNLAYETQIEAARASLKEQQALQAEQRRQYDANTRTYQDELLRFAPDYLISRIRAGATESDELSESIAQSFLDGKTSVEDFQKSYRETRKVYHQRALRLERATRNPSILE